MLFVLQETGTYKKLNRHAIIVLLIQLNFNSCGIFSFEIKTQMLYKTTANLVNFYTPKIKKVEDKYNVICIKTSPAAMR